MVNRSLDFVEDRSRFLGLMRVLSYVMSVLPSPGYTYNDLRVGCNIRWRGAIFQSRFGFQYGFVLDVPYGMVSIPMNELSYGEAESSRGCILSPYVWGG